MKKFIICCSLLCSYAFAQEYNTGLQFKDGFTAIYYSRAGAPTSSLFKTPESITRYGLLSKEKKIVLPMRYKAVMSTYEPGIYIVQDTLNKSGLYNACTSKFITAMDYYEIELFVDGLAVVKKQKEPTCSFAHRFILSIKSKTHEFLRIGISKSLSW